MKSYKILDLLRDDDAIVRAEIMSDEMKKEVLKLEMKRVKEMVPLINTGVKEASDEKEAIIAIKDSEKEDSPNKIKNTLTLRSESGKIIGEELYDKNMINELKNRSDVYFLSDNFVTYTRLTHPDEKQFFVVSKGSRDFITEKDIEDTVESLTVAIPSIEADNYIKDCFEIPHETNLETFIIGFTK